MPETSRQMKVSDINVCISACVCTPFIVRSLKLESEDIILESDAWFYSRNKHLLQHGTKKSSLWLISPLYQLVRVLNVFITQLFTFY